MRRRAKRSTRGFSAGLALLALALLGGTLTWILDDDAPARAPLDALTVSAQPEPEFGAVEPLAGALDGARTPVTPQALRGDLQLELVDATTGAPVPRVRVTLGLEDSVLERFELPRALRADAQGRLSVPWPSGLDALSLVFHPTADTQRKSWRPPSAGEHRVPLPPRGGALAGMVVDENWEPVPGAEVRAWRGTWATQPDWQRPEHVSVADAAGRFELRNLLGDRGEAESWLLGAESLDGRTGHRVAVDVLDATPRAEPVTLVLAPRFDVSGRVVDDDRRPIELARVTATRLGARFDAWRARQTGVEPERLPPVTQNPGVIVFTDADGRFALPLSEEPWRLAISRRGFYPWEGEVSADAELDVMLHTGADLRGQVRDHEGRPLHGALVRVWDRESPEAVGTHSNGGYLVARVFEGRRWPLVVTAPGHAPYREWITVSRHAESRHDVQLERGRRLRVKLVDEAGTPLAGWRLSVRDETPLPAAPGDPWLGKAGTQIGISTDVDGLASHADLGAEPLRVIAQEPTHLESLAVAVIVPDDELHTIRVSDHAAGFARVHLQVYTSTPDAPLEGWRLSASRVLPDGELGGRHPLGSTDAYGRSTRSLLPGRWRIEAVESLATQRDGHPARVTVPLIVELTAGDQHVAVYEAAD